MRPSPILWIQTTGWPFTGKCFSKCSVARDEGVEAKSNAPAPSMGSMLRRIVSAFISVHTPAAFHHRRNQLGLLLVRAGKVLARKIVTWLIFDALFAVGDELIDDVEVLVERDVHGFGGQVGLAQACFVRIQGERSVVVDVVGFDLRRSRTLQLRGDRRNYEQTHSSRCQHPRAK